MSSKVWRNHLGGVSNGDKTQYRLMDGTIIDTIAALRFDSMSDFIYVMDSVRNFPAPSPHFQWYYVRNWGNGEDDVHLRHRGPTGNFLFGDAHVGRLGYGDLVGHYGDNKGSDAFSALAIDASLASDLNLYPYAAITRP